jgi:hypothetical protein
MLALTAPNQGSTGRDACTVLGVLLAFLPMVSTKLLKQRRVEFLTALKNGGELATREFLAVPAGRRAR